METKKVFVDGKVKSASLDLRSRMGSASKAVKYLNDTYDVGITLAMFNNMIFHPQRFTTDRLYRAITGSDPDYTIDDRIEFVRGMIRWYMYFTDETKRDLEKIGEGLGLKKESLYNFLTHKTSPSFRRSEGSHFRTVEHFSLIESYFLNWYSQERFRSREEVKSFVDEMDKLAQEFPMYDKVSREVIEDLVMEITRDGGISPSSLWPSGYSRKNPESRKTFPFSDYQRLVKIRDEKQQLTDRALGLLYKFYEQCSSFKDYLLSKKSLSDINGHEEQLLKLEGWEIKQVPEKRLVELRRVNARG